MAVNPIELRFDGVSRGARRAGNDTVQTIRAVRKEAGAADRDVSVLGRSLRTALGVGGKIAAGGPSGEGPLCRMRYTTSAADPKLAPLGAST